MFPANQIESKYLLKDQNSDISSSGIVYHEAILKQARFQSKHVSYIDRVINKGTHVSFECKKLRGKKHAVKVLNN